MTPPPSTIAATAYKYMFSGHAIGASAHFHTLDQTTGLDHAVPTQAASVLPPTGGISQGAASKYTYKVDQPRPRTLLAVDQATSKAAGRSLGDRYETEVEVDVQSLEVVEKLRIGLLRMHMLSTSAVKGKEPVVTTTGNRIEDITLGTVKVKIDWDDEPLLSCGSQKQLAALYSGKSATDRKKYAWRYATPAGAPEITAHGKHYRCSLVRGLELVGSEKDKQDMSVDGYTIIWNGFGKIILGEVHVKKSNRHLTLVRLAMGSDAGGTGSSGSGQSNGPMGT